MQYTTYVASSAPPPQWDAVLAAAAQLQALVPDAVLVGGTAAAHHAGHRISFDDDHVLTDLRERFDQVLEALESSEGWVTARVKRPVLILGSLDGVETGIRQLIRQRPLDLEEIDVGGRVLRVPTLAETLRIKGWLVLVRNATRDYLDLVALAARLGPDAPGAVLALDEYYQDQVGPCGRRIATQLVKQLADPAPYDLDDVDLNHYRGLVPRWQHWGHVVEDCRSLAGAVLERGAGGSP